MVNHIKRAARNKGFTLVEIVIVIVIIGVLAAILVPTLVGTVQDARIASGNQAAKEIKDKVNSFLTTMDTNSTAYKGGDKTITITVQDKTWTISGVNGGNDWLDGIDHWTTAAQVHAPDIVPNQGTELLSYMADALRDLSFAYITIYIEDGRVFGAAVAMDTSSPADAMPALNDFKNGEFSFGGSSKAGIVNSVIVGTSPVLILP